VSVTSGDGSPHEPEDRTGPVGVEARRPWREGPDPGVVPGSWLALDDDELLHRIEGVGSEEDADDDLLDVVTSERHFFVRQEAAKRVVDRRRLFAFEDDRHVGQILVRHLTRREDITYLERLAIRSRHVEVRSAAQVQLARVWRRLDGPRPSVAQDTAPVAKMVDPAGSGLSAGTPVEQPSSAALAQDGVDGSLLGWAAHFVVEQAWGHLGTNATRELLRRTHAELLATRPALRSFAVNQEAHVVMGLETGVRLPRGAVRDVAVWMTAFRAAATEVAHDLRSTSVRACTALMADALRDAGFYAACDEAEGPGGLAG
jgi:hypothetical protein